MGGGDLNTKKSWHPNTIKNQERVWKAEQAEAHEKRRIDDLRREINDERSREELTNQGQSSGVLSAPSDKKMDWMYKQPNASVDREQYLLGKAIDKTFEKIISEDQGRQSYMKAPPKNHVEHECIPFSIRNLSGSVQPNDNQVDMTRKLLEDPLVAIRKRELESRTELLQNPVKLKELTMLLKIDQARKKKKKDKKKSKKHKSDLDSKLVEKLLKLHNVKDGKVNIKDLLLSSPKSSNKSSKKKKKKRHHSETGTDSDCNLDSDSDVPKRPSPSHKRRKDSSSERKCKQDDKTRKEKRTRCDSRGYITNRKEKSQNSANELEEVKPGNSRKEKQYSERSNYKADRYQYENVKEYYDDDDDDAIPLKKNYGLVKADGSKIQITHKKHDSAVVKTETVVKRWERPERSRLDDKQKEEKRKEMMQDATRRDKEREKYVSNYRDQEKKREAIEKKQQFKEDFAEKQWRAAASHGTVESRIKSNIYNIQRSNRDMDTHFAKRH